MWVDYTVFDRMDAKGYATEALYTDWRHWSYEQWNERLIAYSFGRGARAIATVERIPATPEELVQVIDDPAADPHEVTEAFVSCVKEKLPLNAVSFCRFCQSYGNWSPQSSDPPHFFAMLWLTCLVAYGYPDIEEDFYDRIKKLFGRRLTLNCLPDLWSDLATWTNKAARIQGVRIGTRLKLPPHDDYRSIIGHSWFLAFPHRNDRLKLRKLLEVNELSGDEPPITPVLNLLNRDREIFSRWFRQDLKNFIDEFLDKGKDARESAFWRAVRQEAIYTDSGTEEIEDSNGLNLMSSLEDDELVLYLACGDGTRLPSGFSKQPLGFRIGDISNYVIRNTPDSTAAGQEEAVKSVLSGGMYVPRVTRHVNRGVLVFKEELTNEYKLVGGADANEANVALVSESKVEAFVRAYDGVAYPSRVFPKWHEVIDCEVVVRRDLPPGLEGVLHLQETMFPPVARFVGGIRSGRDFHLMPGFMPSIKFKGARLVELFDSSGVRVDLLTKVSPDGSEWGFRDDLLNLRADRYTVRVTWSGDDGVERTTETELTLVEGQREEVSPEYKGLGAGRYYIESCSPGERVVSGDEILPLGILGGELTEGGPDLVELSPELRYLGPGFGEFSSTRRQGFDWLVTGTNKNPDLLLFVGDPESPQLPLNRKSGSASDRRYWKKAMNSRRVAARLPDGRIVPIESLSKVHEAFIQYKGHGTRTDAQVFLNEDWERESSPCDGIEPDSRVARFTDALAALSVRRSGVSFKDLLDLLAAMSGRGVGSAPAFIFDIARGWVESGAFDIAYAQGRRASYVVPRRPFFVAYRVATYVHAALIGLVPSALRAKVERTAVARKCDLSESLPPCRWLPKILRLKCDDPETLKNISEVSGLASPRWLKWPIDTALDLRPDDQRLREDAPDDSFLPLKVWDWSQGRFVRAKTLDTSFTQVSGISVEMRSHRERCSIYSMSLEGAVWGWTHIRNWALLLAYELKDGHSPLAMSIGGSINRTGDIGVYLPLPVGRLCAVLGEGLAGPVLRQDAISVQEYVYPLGRTYLEKLSPLLPVYCDNGPEVHA